MSRTGPFRLAAFDLDGTLIEPGGGLGPEVKQAIARLRRRGVMVIIVTGRMHRTAQAFARELDLHGLPLVSFNGAMARVVAGPAYESAEGDEVLWHRAIAPAEAQAVITFLADRGLEPLVFAGDRLYAGHPDPSRIDLYRYIAHIEPEYVGDLGTLVTAGRVRATKLIQIEPAENMPPLYAAARERFDQRLMVTTSYPFFLEFMHRRAGKGRALAAVSRRLGVRRRETAAFGDGMNDIDMLIWAGLGVAVGHGPPALLAAADAVAEGPPGLAVARFIEQYLLGGQD